MPCTLDRPCGNRLRVIPLDRGHVLIECWGAAHTLAKTSDFPRPTELPRVRLVGDKSCQRCRQPLEAGRPKSARFHIHCATLRANDRTRKTRRLTAKRKTR